MEKMTQEIPTDTSPIPANPDAREANCQESTAHFCTLTLVAIEPGRDTQAQFEISRRDWLAIARIAAASDYLDARVIGRMMDPQPGYEFSSDICEDMDIPLLRTLEWLERFRADRIYLSASVVRIRDEHDHIDPTTTFLDLQDGRDDSELDWELLHRFRNFTAFGGGFKILQVFPIDGSATDPTASTGASGASQNPARRLPIPIPIDDDEPFEEDDDSDFPWEPSIGTTGEAELPTESLTGEPTPENSGCEYCGVVGCSACTYNEMYALDLLAGLCGFAAKQAETLEEAIRMVRALCDELVLAEAPDGWIEWIGAIDPEIATIATHAIRSDSYLAASLSSCFAEPSDFLLADYQNAQHRALEELRAGYPVELRPADVRVYW